MVRGTFANIRIKNKLVDYEGGFTICHPLQKEMSVYDASKYYISKNIDTVVVGGKNMDLDHLELGSKRN